MYSEVYWKLQCLFLKQNDFCNKYKFDLIGIKLYVIYNVNNEQTWFKFRCTSCLVIKNNVNELLNSSAD